MEREAEALAKRVSTTPTNKEPMPRAFSVGKMKSHYTQL
jgi:hypothetical protein